MNSIVMPAIALMDRLSYGWKFCLIGLLCFIPLGVVSGLVIQQAYERVQATQQALDSMLLIEQVGDIVRDAETLRDLEEITYHLGISEHAGDLEQRTKTLRQRLQARLANLPLNQSVPGASELAVKQNELLAVYDELGRAALRNRAGLAAKAYDSAAVLLSLSATYAGLNYDDERRVRDLTEIMVNKTPQITSALGQARAISAYSVALGSLSSVASSNLDALLEQSQRLSADYAESLSALQNDSTLTSLQLPAEQSGAAIAALQISFEDDILLASHLSGDWNIYFQRMTAEIDKAHAMNTAILNALEGALQERLAEGRTALLILVCALMFVLLLVAYLYVGFYMATRRTLGRLSLFMRQVAGGDMRVQVKVDSLDELGDLAGEFNVTVSRIRELIREVSQTSDQVHGQSRQVEIISSDSSQAVAAQRNQIEQVAAAMNEMAATSQEVARSAALAVTSAELVNSETVDGRQLVDSSVKGIEKLAVEIESAVKVINQLADNSSSISRVLDVIKGIAEQTNLLALNAAIEAARAGEQGRGFAVVADEVRTLAQRTQQSTEEIEHMISQLQNGVGAAVKAMSSSHSMTDATVRSSRRVQQALDNILRAVVQIVDQSQQIAAAAEQQTAVSHDIDQNIVEINQAGERTAEGARQTEESSSRMGQLVEELQRIISAFRI